MRLPLGSSNAGSRGATFLSLLLGAAFPILSSCADEAPATPDGDAAKTKVLFDGKSLKGWKEVDFGGNGEIYVEDGALILGMGEVMTGIVVEGDPPYRINYEISLEAKRISGTDFFCGLTFPIKEACCTFIVGGWGGSLVGISSIDRMDASENETGSVQHLEDDRWYKLRLRVTDQFIRAWIDEKRVVNLPYEGRQLGMRPGEIESCMPLGIASFQTKAALRNIVITPVDPDEEKP